MKHGRLTWLTPGELGPEQRKVYDAIAGGPRGQADRHASLTGPAGRLEGPFNAMLFSPAVGGALQLLGAAIRYQGLLPARSRELVILVVARAARSDYEWRAHEHSGRTAGLSETEIGELLAGRAAPSLSAAERLAVQVAESLVTERDVPDGLFAEAVTALGEPVVTELIILVGYYSLLSLSMRVGRTPLPAGVAAVFPPGGPDGGPGDSRGEGKGGR